MNISERFNNALLVTNKDPALREEVMNLFKSNVLGLVNCAHGYLLVFMDNSMSMKLGRELFSFEDQEEFAYNIEDIVESYPVEVSEIISGMSAQLAKNKE